MPCTFLYSDSSVEENFLQAKQAGFSDRQIARLIGVQENDVRKQRIQLGITPWVKQVGLLEI